MRVRLAVFPAPPLTLLCPHRPTVTYKAKLLAFGIPLDNVAFKTLETAVAGQTLGKCPAGLVATPM